MSVRVFSNTVRFGFLVAEVSDDVYERFRQFCEDRKMTVGSVLAAAAHKARLGLSDDFTEDHVVMYLDYEEGVGGLDQAEEK